MPGSLADPGIPAWSQIDESDLDYINGLVINAMAPGSVTLLTRKYGRGLDFKIQKSKQQQRRGAGHSDPSFRLQKARRLKSWVARRGREKRGLTG